MGVPKSVDATPSELAVGPAGVPLTPLVVPCGAAFLMVPLLVQAPVANTTAATPIAISTRRTSAPRSCCPTPVMLILPAPPGRPSTRYRNLAAHADAAPRYRNTAITRR